MLTDKQLVGNAARGDQSALESLYDRHSPTLYSLAVRITGNTDSAEELLQDTFFQLWQRASQFETFRGSLIGWLLAMIRHRAIARIRQHKVQLSLESAREETTEFPETSSSTLLDWNLAHELVSAALTALPNLQRDAITLAYFDGLTCEEIATQTRTPVGTVRVSLRSAVGAMKRRLSDFGGPAATLESILITDQLFSRTCRQREPDLEAKYLQTLTQANSASPAQLIDRFLQVPLGLCRAGTAGLSLLETNAAGEQQFRWTNLAGKLATSVGGTTPRNFSPCGVTLDRNSPQLFAYPGRYFQYFNQVECPIVEGLVIPFHMGPKAEGTVWIVSHDQESRFDSEDARIMTTLAEFVGCSLHVSSLLNGNSMGTSNP
jgi:RNA polymerase sigma factor (sigma-70 family)